MSAAGLYQPRFFICGTKAPAGSREGSEPVGDPIKQVAPVVKDEANEIVVITVYTFYF